MSRRILLRPAAVLLCLLLVLPVHAFGESTPDGSIRVLMTRLALTDTAELLLDGSYTCGEMAFQQGSKVTLQLRDGGIRLYYEGMVRDMGKQVTFLRHQLPGQTLNGIRVGGAYPLYCGDLLFDIDKGLLRCVARLEIEEYLLGVLPYEMSSAFPLEALKAQAVAARTYALTHLNPDRAYDVEDNTNDQVYAGITADAPSIRSAVQSTEGICVYYKGSMVPCYYTASNGGLVESIENVWGVNGPYGYVHRKADPYDLANEESPVLSLQLPKTWGEKENAGVLGTFLKPRLQEALEQRGYGPETEVRVRAMTEASLESPTNEGSGVHQNLRLSVLVSVRGKPAPDNEEEVTLLSSAAPAQTPAGTDAPVSPSPAPTQASSDGEEEIYLNHLPSPTPAPTPSLDGWTDLAQPVILSLSYFGEVESAFSLSLNGANNEVTTLQEEKSAFVLQARRFGHGVGLSQRGAQRMAAKEGWGYRQILRYYYQGITLKRVSYTYQTAKALSASFLSTPAPPATPTPRPTLMPVTLRPGETKVIVNQISSDSTLNLRRESNTTSDILMRLYFGQELAVLEQQGDWIRVRTDAAEGYVMLKYVSPVQEE